MPSIFILESKASAVIDDDLEAFVLELQREDLSGEKVPKYRRQTLPENNPLHKIINLELRYSCMPNMKTIISRHNKKNCYQIAIGPEI